MQDAGNNSWNGHSHHDRLLDDPNIGQLHNNEHALDNAGLLAENMHLGTIHFPEKHIVANISDRLFNAHIDFGVWPKDAEGRIPESEEALRCDKLAFFGMEFPLDRPVLTSDCGSDACQRKQKRTASGIGIVVRVTA